MLNNIQKGRVGEAAMIYVAAREGWGIALPHLCELKYDVAIKITEKLGWQKVQCKIAAKKRKDRKTTSVDLRRAGNKSYADKDFDYLFAYDIEWEAAWLIPKKVIKARTEISPRDEQYTEYRVL